MNTKQENHLDTDESDEDFVPDVLAGESSVSEDEAEDSEPNEHIEANKERGSIKRKRETKKVKRKAKPKHKDESEDDANTTRRSRRLRGAEENGKGKNLEKDVLSDEEDKSRTNALWEDFLKDVNTAETLPRVSPSKVESKPSSFNNNEKQTSKSRTESQSKLNITSTIEDGKILVAEIANAAGDDISISKALDSSSIKENKAATIATVKKQPFSRIMPGAGIKRTGTAAVAGSTTGLGSIINQLGKKKKLSVLEKSQMDWKSFKQSEGIDEQLQTYNKGKDGYLERQDFLQRTDLRQFEIEKNLRQTSRRPH